MAISVGLDWALHFAASDLGLHCLPRPFSSNTKGKYGWLMLPVVDIWLCSVLSPSAGSPTSYIRKSKG